LGDGLQFDVLAERQLLVNGITGKVPVAAILMEVGRVIAALIFFLPSVFSIQLVWLQKTESERPAWESKALDDTV